MAASQETAYLELLSPDARGVGELVVTTLTNDFMPLIRYRIGDLASRQELPYFTDYVVHGRAADAFVSDHGERVTPWQIDQCFAGLEGFVHYQLHEPPDDRLQLRYVPDGPGPKQGDLAELSARLTRALGPSRGVNLEAVDLLLAESSGKFRLGYPAVQDVATAAEAP
jgi:phenylacetate-CoA ligase